MKLLQLISNGTRFLSEAILRIFSPNKDNYPTTGVQPFTGEVPNPESSKKL